MKSFFLATIVIAIGIINTVSAVEYVDQEMYGVYQDQCLIAGPEKCNTVGYCVVAKGKLSHALIWILQLTTSMVYL